MPVRDSATPLPHSKPRSGMFKWMISGHKGHKQKQEKLNNATVAAAAINNNNNKNKNNFRQTDVDEEEAQQVQQNNSNSNGSVLHIPDNTEITYNNNNNSSINNTNNHNSGGNSTYDHHHHNHQQQQQQQQQPHTQKHGDVNQNTDSLIPASGVTSGIGNDTPPSPPASRPPPLPTHPPPPVPPHAQPLPQPPTQPLPPLPGHQQEDHRYQLEENRYQDEASPKAPGTCILPRRALGKEEVSIRYRSPSNPPPASRQPPPYSRHQPPDPHRRPRGPYQPPPPPKADFRDPRDHRESRPREVRSSVNLDELQDCRSRWDHWAEGDPRGGPSPRNGQKSCNFREVRDTWEKRNSAIVPQNQNQEDNLRSSSLPRPKPETWLPPNNRWSTREPDSGFDSLNLQTADDAQRCTEAVQGCHNRAQLALPTDAHYSQSTEDLLNASRTSPMSLSSATASTSSTASSPVQYPTIRPAKQPCITGASHTSPFSHNSPRSSPRPPSGSPRGVRPPHHHSTPVGPQRTASPEGALLSDSVYPQHDTQPRYAEIQEHTEPRTKEERVSHRFSRDLRDVRDVRELGGNRESREPGRTGRDLRDPREPRDNRSSRELRQSKDMKSREFRETSLPRDFRDTREERLPRDVATRGFREMPVDVDERDQVELRHDRLRVPREGRLHGEGSKEVRFSRDTSESLRVRDGQAYDRRDRDGDGADGLQVNDERRLPAHHRDHRGQRGDGCTSSSVSWMEWTQQLQAYVAWVNSQLRKRGRPLISDLRRDLQSGVVFADLIEIISGERVAGVQREGERESLTPQTMRENLDRILQFMAAKRIRMTHITSKEVAEGNLKSIMRVILALAAHYKPQSVKAASPHQQEPPPAALSCASAKHPATQDVSVGPDAPAGGSQNTPNLSANRRAIVTGGSGDDPGGVPGLRRHPSMTATPGAPRDSSPVYENLPRRVAPSRWAYDSLRASHKFQWSGPPSRRPGPASGPNRPSLDESSDDPLNTSLNTSLTISLNTSIEADVEPPSPSRDSSDGRGSGRPAALNFWQDLTNRRDPSVPQATSQPETPAQTPSEDNDNPFRYHTIHRMSGRRKLPQIPGAVNPSNRVTTPQEGSESPRDAADSPSDRSEGKPMGGGGLGEEGSREPEGRSQNSSPATSLVRGHTLEQWPREKPQMDAWDTEDLKNVLRDLNSTRDQLLALQHLLQTSTVVESRGVSTSRGSPSFTPLASPTCLTPTHTSPLCLTPTHSSPSCLTPTHTSPPCLTPNCHTPTLTSPPCHSPHSNIPTEANSSHFVAPSCHSKDSPTKATQTVDAQAKSSHAKGNNPTRSSHSKENIRRSHRRKDNPLKMSPSKDESSRTSHVKEETARISHSKDDPSKSFHSKEKPRRDDHAREDPNRKHFTRKTVLREHTTALVDPASGAPSRSRGSHHPHRRHSHQELDPTSRGSHGPRSSELLEASTASVKQELLHLSLARQALEAEKAELTRLLEQREGVITELRKQMHHRDKAMHTQRAQFEDALRNVQNGKRAGVCGDSPSSRGGPREELHLVRDAIASLRSNFRETDPNQHTLDTLEQAISILIERSNSSSNSVGGGSNDKNSRGSDQRPQMNGMQEASTKVIYFTERTVTPFMSTINKPLGEIRLRDFKNMFDRPGLFRFHFKSYDPEYGMVKEEIVNDDDILPGVEGKIIAWVEEDVE